MTVLVQFEFLIIKFTHVGAFRHLLKIFLQLSQLVVLPCVVWQDWDPVLKLEDVRVRRVVY